MMKASVKLRDEQEPLVRAKIPLSILGMPICSGVTMGCSHELGLHVSTLFGAGPSCRVTFLPNDSQTPLCVMLKAGLGAWGSPKGSCLVFSAQLKLPTTQQQQQPSFSFSIKPQFGDFSFCKDWRGIQLPRREAPSPAVASDDGSSSIIAPVSVSVAELAKVFDKREGQQNSTRFLRLSDNKNKNKNKAVCVDAEDGNEIEIDKVARIKGWNVLVNSSLPLLLLGQRVCAGIKWRMEIPSSSSCCYLVDMLASHPHPHPHKLFTRSRLPVLTVDKLSLHHHMYTEESETVQSSKTKQRKMGIQEEEQEVQKVASMCATLRRQLHRVYSENQVLKSTMEELRSNFNNTANNSTTMSPMSQPHAAASQESRRANSQTVQLSSKESKEPAAAASNSSSNSSSVAEELKRAIAANANKSSS